MVNDIWDRVKILAEDLEEEDIAFILETRNDIVTSIGVRERIDIAAKGLYEHHLFKDSVIEVYIRDEEGSPKCAAIEGMDESQKQLFIDQTINPFSDRDKIIEVSNIKGESFQLPLNSIGYLLVSMKDGELTDYQKKFLEHYASNNLTFSIQRALNYEKNWESAIKDPLTDLYNIRYLEHELPKLVEAEKRHAGLCLAFLDIDYFKNFNDKNPEHHAGGDNILRIIGKILKENTRVEDIPARYGGDEFVLVLKDIDLTGAGKKIELIRYVVETHAFPNQIVQPGGKLTITAGLSHMPTHTLGDYEQLLLYADRALYHGKHSGRNIVVPYNPDVIGKCDYCLKHEPLLKTRI